MSSEGLIRFVEVVGKLKVVKRSGWISHVGIANPESVADHSFRCAVMAMCIGDLLPDLDTDRLIRMLLLHDIQEALIGDYDTPAKERVGISTVKVREQHAAKNIFSLLPAELKTQCICTWKEFDECTTAEAVLANDIDKIEMIFQALEYEKEGYEPEKLEAFWASVQDKIRTPTIREMLKLLSLKRTTET